jgi:hypothetical protein
MRPGLDPFTPYVMGCYHILINHINLLFQHHPTGDGTRPPPEGQESPVRVTVSAIRGFLSLLQRGQSLQRRP